MSNGSWEKIYLEQGEVQVEVLDTVVEGANIFRSNKCEEVLDLGCGTGRHSIYLASKGFKVYACDLSKSGIEIAKKNAEKYGFRNIKYSIENMYRMNYSDKMFDGILCIWVQGHGTRDQVQRGINEAYRVLRDKGVFFTDFVTVDDVTYGLGDKIADNTFVGGRPGEEGIPHYYTTKEDLTLMFEKYSKVNMYDKTYKFVDKYGNEHKIESIVVNAVK